MLLLLHVLLHSLVLVSAFVGWTSTSCTSSTTRATATTRVMMASLPRTNKECSHTPSTWLCTTTLAEH